MFGLATSIANPRPNPAPPEAKNKPLFREAGLHAVAPGRPNVYNNGKKRMHRREEAALDKRMKIYLDTSVISYLDQTDSPEKMADTLKFWEFLKRGSVDVFVSTVTMEELGRNIEPKLGALRNYLGQIKHTVIEVDEVVKYVANKIIENGILTKKNFDDCVHIASSLLYECDCIVSWNFKHIVNIKTIKGMKIVAAQTGYGGSTMICTPSYLTEGA